MQVPEGDEQKHEKPLSWASVIAALRMQSHVLPPCARRDLEEWIDLLEGIAALENR